MIATREIKSLREWRAVRYLTIERLAALAGVSAKTIWTLEHGKPVQTSTIIKVAQALGIEPGQIEEAKR